MHEINGVKLVIQSWHQQDSHTKFNPNTERPRDDNLISQQYGNPNAYGSHSRDYVVQTTGKCLSKLFFADEIKELPENNVDYREANE